MGIAITPGFKRYFANTSWLMGHRILSMIVALFVGVYVARYLGPERFGLLSYAGSFVGLFIALATLGLGTYKKIDERPCYVKASTN